MFSEAEQTTCGPRLPAMSPAPPGDQDAELGQHPSAASAREASPLHFEDEPVSGLFSTNPGTWPFIKSGKRKKKILPKAPGELYLFCMALIQYIQLEKTATLPLPVLRK